MTYKIVLLLILSFCCDLFSHVENLDRLINNYEKNKSWYNSNSKAKVDLLNKIDKEILLNKKRSRDIKNNYFEKILDLIEKLKTEKEIDVIFDVPFIKENCPHKYRPSNPSIIKSQDGYYVISKAINFGCDGYFYAPLISGQPLNGRNFFLTYDKNFNLKSEKEISNFNGQIFGSDFYDDCRIFEYKDGYYFICSRVIFNLVNQALCQFCLDKIKIENALLLKGPNLKRHEKNWLPIFINNELCFIYLYEPYTILKRNINGECEIIRQENYNLDFSNFRGSAAPIEFDNGYLMMVHELNMVKNKRKYTHRFLYLDKDYNIKKLSRPFIFKHIGIEFCISMTIDHEAKELIVPIGIEDKEAKIYFYDLEYVKSLLRPV